MDTGGRQSLDAAVRAGVIDAEQAEKLKNFFAGQQAAREHDARDEAAPSIDEEDFRLVTSFNDIFVTIGLVTLFSGLAALLRANAAYAMAPFAWGLAEIFTRRHRMALPSIILAAVFVASVAAIVFALGGTSGGDGQRIAILASLASLAAAWAHDRRFGAPFDQLMIAGAVVALAGVLILPSVGPSGISLFFGVAGLCVFAAAMVYDLSDPLRRTRRSDKAFWLHLLAAPLIVHSLFGGRGFFAQIDDAQAVGLLLTVSLIVVVAILIDRRALIVSALTYVGGAVGVIAKHMGDLGGGAGVSLLAIALVVLSLSVWWRGLRARILPLLPFPRLIARLPPAKGA